MPFQKMTAAIKKEIIERINNEEDYLFSSRYAYSIKKLLNKHPEGVSVKFIANTLMMTEKEVEAIYARIIGKLQSILKVTSN